MAALEDAPLADSLLSEARSRKFDLLLHLAVNLSQPIVVSGPAGMGKTTFLRRLEASARAYATVRYFAATAGTTYETLIEELRQAAIRDLNLPNAAEWACADLMAKYAQERRLLVLMLDNADRLLPGLLSALWEFARQNPSLHIVLALPSDALRRKATTDALALRDAQPLEIPSLTPAEFSTYLRRLAASKPGTSAWNISTTTSAAAWHDSQGVPGAALRALEMPIETAPAKGPTGHVRWLVPGLAALLLAGVAVLLWRPDARPPASMPQDSASHKADTDVSAPVVVVQEPSGGSSVPAPAGSGANPRPEAESVPAWEGPLPESGTVPHPEIAPAFPPNAIGPSLPEPDLAKPVESTTAPEPGKKPSASQPEANSAQPGPPSAPAITAPAESEAKPAEAIPAERQARIKAAHVDLAGAHNVDWLMAQNPEAYTLQIVAMSQAQALAGTIGRFPPDSDLSVLRLRKGRGDLYLLFYGVYPNMATAREGAANLPPPLTQSIPRQFKSIQADVLRPASPQSAPRPNKPASYRPDPADITERMRVPHQAQQP